MSLKRKIKTGQSFAVEIFCTFLIKYNEITSFLQNNKQLQINTKKTKNNSQHSEREALLSRARVVTQSVMETEI